MLAYANLSGMAAWLSDALCGVATVGGFATRTLYTDDEEIFFDFVRPIVVNGIEDAATRPDLEGVVGTAVRGGRRAACEEGKDDTCR